MASLSDSRQCEIIAEAGCTHGGRLDVALDMVRIANWAGCNTVKFQAFIPEKIPHLTKIEKIELNRRKFSRDDFKRIKQLCEHLRIEFLVTPFDVDSVGMLVDVGAKRLKIPSGRSTDYELLKAAANTELPVMFSTGMVSLREAERAYRFLLAEGADGVTVFQCTTAYPTKPKDVNLNVLVNLRDRFPVVGFSDHTTSTVIPAAAVAMGYRLIEKHFYHPKVDPGLDYPVSLHPERLKEMVENVRDVEKAMGSYTKKIIKVERKMLHRKVIE